MIKLNHNLTRLAIFVFYDPQGTIDRYVTYLLEALRPNVTRLVVVSNTELDNSNRERLERCCDDLFVRENRGLDAAASSRAWFLSAAGKRSGSTMR